METVSLKRLVGHPVLSWYFSYISPSSLFPSRFTTKMLHVFLISPMCAKCSVQLICLDFITLIVGYLMTSTRYEALHYVIFSIYPSFLSRVSKYTPQGFFKEKTKVVLYCVQGLLA
jgi:hypothetical protein